MPKYLQFFHVTQKDFFSRTVDFHTLKVNGDQWHSNSEKWVCVKKKKKTLEEASEIIYCVCQSDCPQVQCVSQYVATQADELSLEPSDVINVLRKTIEGTVKIKSLNFILIFKTKIDFHFTFQGWYEGMRPSDGKKGWFPAENTSEVTTDHQRRRNVREKYQIAQATSQNTPV